MDTKYLALDIAIQHARQRGFLPVYTLPVLKIVNKQIMRSVMTTIRVFLAWQRRNYANSSTADTIVQLSVRIIENDIIFARFR